MRHDWTREEVQHLFALPFSELIYRAHSVHRAHFDPREVQISTLLSIKTGGCPEDCAYCPQSAEYDTGVKADKLMDVDAVLADARAASDAGATRFCMGAAWRSPKDKDLDKVCQMVEGVKALGMESCVTLGMLTGPQAQKLKDAGLDYYNHNLDTSPEYYERHHHDTHLSGPARHAARHVRDAGIHVCCGGIVGMGETADDRVGMIHALCTLPAHPESVPINMLVQVEGTPVSLGQAPDAIEFVRTIAVARLTMPESMVRLSAGREDMSDEAQALCLFAGANSIFYGPKLLTTPNPNETTTVPCSTGSACGRWRSDAVGNKEPRLVRQRLSAYLAALHPDEDGAPAAARGAHLWHAASCWPTGANWSMASPVVDRRPWLQPSAHCRRRRPPSSRRCRM